MSKKLFKTIVCMCVAFIIVCALFELTHPDGQTGMQWMAKQDVYVGELASLTDDIDTVLTLYISGNISEKDFLEHVSVFKSQLEILYASYQNDLAETPVKSGTHNYYSKTGCESVDNSYKLVNNILITMKNNSSDKDMLSYKYMSFKQEANKQASKYVLARYYLSDATEYTERGSGNE